MSELEMSDEEKIETWLSCEKSAKDCGLVINRQDGVFSVQQAVPKVIEDNAFPLSLVDGVVLFRTKSILALHAFLTGYSTVAAEKELDPEILKARIPLVAKKLLEIFRQANGDKRPVLEEDLFILINVLKRNF